MALWYGMEGKQKTKMWAGMDLDREGDPQRHDADAEELKEMEPMSVAQAEMRWRLELMHARRDLTLLTEEARAKNTTDSRLRAAAVRFHVQQLACWVQSEIDDRPDIL